MRLCGEKSKPQRTQKRHLLLIKIYFRKLRKTFLLLQQLGDIHTKITHSFCMPHASKIIVQYTQQ